MHNNDKYSSISCDENKELFDEKQNLSDIEMQKLKNVIKTKIAGELTIKSSDLERTLYLAGQNLPKNTIEKIREILEETYHTDEYFLDEIEHILAPYWEELTNEEKSQLLMESFEIFDIEKQGFLPKQDLIKNLTTLGDMPLNPTDLKLMFSMVETSKKSSNIFDYHKFVQKLFPSEISNKKKKKKIQVQRTIK